MGRVPVHHSWAVHWYRADKIFLRPREAGALRIFEKKNRGIRRIGAILEMQTGRVSQAVLVPVGPRDAPEPPPVAPNEHQSETAQTPGASGSTSRSRVMTRPRRQAPRPDGDQREARSVSRDPEGGKGASVRETR